MTMPLVLLAIPSFGLGMGVYAFRDDLVHLGTGLILPLLMATLGIVLGWLMCRQRDPIAWLGPVGPWIGGGFGLDRVQRWIVVEPALALARAVRVGDESGVDGVVMGVGRLTEASGAGLNRWHRAALPRAFAGVLAGAMLLVIAGVTVGLW